MSSERFLREHTRLKQIMGSFSIRCLHFSVYQPWWTKYAVLFYRGDIVFEEMQFWDIIAVESQMNYVSGVCEDVLGIFIPVDGSRLFETVLSLLQLCSHSGYSGTMWRSTPGDLKPLQELSYRFCGKEYYWNPYWSASYMSLNKWWISDVQISWYPFHALTWWKSKRWCKVSLLCIVVHAGQEVLLFFPLSFVLMSLLFLNVHYTFIFCFLCSKWDV